MAAFLSDAECTPPDDKCRARAWAMDLFHAMVYQAAALATEPGWHVVPTLSVEAAKMWEELKARAALPAAVLAAHLGAEDRYY